MWEFLDKIIYINLDEREDRRKIMNNFFTIGKIPLEKIQRFSAIKHEIGAIGASQSHIDVLKLAKINGWKNVLILEDDVEWIDSKYDEIERLMKTEWDVFMLGGTYIEKQDLQVKIAYSGYSYIAREHYYDKLIQNLEEGLYLKLSKQGSGPTSLIKQMNYKYLVRKDTFHSFDSYWMRLQWKDNWIGISACKHKHTYSDVSKSDNYQDIEVTVGTHEFKGFIEGLKFWLEDNK